MSGLGRLDALVGAVSNIFKSSCPPHNNLTAIIEA
jgi:hypothetical protein